MSKKDKDIKTNEEIKEEVEKEIEEVEQIIEENKSKEISPEEEQILLLKDKVKNLEEKVMQTQAELINYRKRKDEEVAGMLRYSNKDLILEMLPILDNFERALNSKNENSEFDKYQEGYRILYSHMIDTLKKFGVEEIPALNLPFDPNLHEALMVGSEPDKDDDIILEVFNKGYMLKDRVLRPSKVKVNKVN